VAILKKLPTGQRHECRLSREPPTARYHRASTSCFSAQTRFADSPRLGRIARGLQADLVVLNGDPGEDVRALAAVRYMLRAGQVVYPASA
jgi:predicted amidohydrolase YtcJ